MAAPAPLSELERIAREYWPGLCERKLTLVARLGRLRLRRARDVLLLHEVLCFLRAYPDSDALLRAGVRELERFAARPDLARFRAELADSGIAGTRIHFPFHWVTARWLAKHWPDALAVDAGAIGERERERERFETLLPLLLPFAEWPDFDLGWTPEQWLARLKGPRQTDATFLIERFTRLQAAPRIREALFNDLALPLVLEPGGDTPNRTRAWHRLGPPVFQERPLSRERPLLREAAKRPPRSVVRVSPREGTRIIDLAREALLTRGRDLDGIMYASRDDVRVIDAGDGLSLACLGLLPEHRALVETIYVFLLFKNGVPIGYYQAALLFGSAELNYHVFASFRGVETALVYARALGVVHHLFGSDAFGVHPYQLGHENADALAAGAFWFYRKLGFAPDNPKIRAELAREERRMARDPTHRSSEAVLRRLAADYMFFHLRKPRDDIGSKLPLSRFSLAVTDTLAERFGAERERGLRALMTEAARLTGVSLSALDKGGRLAWERWAPLILALPGVERWPLADRRALGLVARAKGAKSEQEFASRLDRHPRLRRALLGLARRAEKKA